MHRQPKWGRRGEPQGRLQEPAAQARPPAGHEVLDVVSRAGLIFFDWTQARGLTYLSDSARELLGYGPEDFRDTPGLTARIVHPDSRAALDAFTEELIENRPARAETEIRMLTRDGRDVWLEARVVPTYGPEGEIVGFGGVAFDATAMVEVREAAAEAEERYRRIFEDAPVPLWLADPETRLILEANAKACELYGYERGELEGARIDELAAPEAWPQVEAHFVRPDGGARLDIITRTLQLKKDGQKFPAQLALGTIRFGGRRRRLVLVRDLAGAEDARDGLEAKRRALAASSEAVMILERARRVAFASGACERLLGFGPEELAGQDPAELMASPPWVDEWRCGVEVAGLGDRWSGWLAFAGGNGKNVEIEAELEPVRGDDGAVSHVIVRLIGGAPETPSVGAEGLVYLEMLRLHLDDLLEAARGCLSQPAPAGAEQKAATQRASAARFVVNSAIDSFNEFANLGTARGAALPLDGVGRDINEVVDEAARRVQPVFAARDVAVVKRSMVQGACSHASVIREALVNLLVEAGRGAYGSVRLEVVLAPCELHGKPAVSATIVGPRPMGSSAGESDRVALARRALETLGGALQLAAEPGEGSPHHARFVVTLPTA